MLFEKQIHDLQDNVRNSGWRIQWIPWQQSGKPEYVYNTPFTLFTGFGGALLFIGGIVYAALQSKTDSYSEMIVGISVAVFGLALGIAGRLYAAWVQQRSFVPVTARVVDREIKETRVPNNRTTTWQFRLICSFWFDGRDYKVTPESPKMVALRTQQAAEEYLARYIKVDNTCTLYVDRNNPLHAVFGMKKRV